MAKWVQEERAQSDSDDDEELGNITYGRQRSKWLPRSLELLFGGRKEIGVDKQMKRVCRQQAYTEEAHLMELLADKEADEERILTMENWQAQVMTLKVNCNIRSEP